VHAEPAEAYSRVSAKSRVNIAPVVST